MFKAVLLGQWHSLSDPELEHSILTRIGFNLFCGFGEMHIPDHSTLCRYRNRLAQTDLPEELLSLINRELTAKGLKVKKPKPPSSTPPSSRPAAENNGRPSKPTPTATSPAKPQGLLTISVAAVFLAKNTCLPRQKCPQGVQPCCAFFLAFGYFLLKKPPRKPNANSPRQRH